MRLCSFGFDRVADPSAAARSLSAAAGFPCACERVVSWSGLFLPALMTRFSFVGNNWYFRGSAGWCIRHTNFSFSSVGVCAGVP